VFRLEFYTPKEIEEIVKRSARILGVEITSEAQAAVAKRARFTPRTANYFLKRARDFAQVGKRTLDEDAVEESLTMLGIDEVGLNPSDRKLLQTIAEKFNGGPVGLGTIAAALSEEEATIEEFNEPYLIQMGFLERTPRGRTVTEAGYKHLGLKVPKNLQEKLL
jgi:Holliday junction DNA helicase RuvB